MQRKDKCPPVHTLSTVDFMLAIISSNSATKVQHMVESMKENNKL